MCVHGNVEPCEMKNSWERPGILAIWFLAIHARLWMTITTYSDCRTRLSLSSMIRNCAHAVLRSVVAKNPYLGSGPAHVSDVGSHPQNSPDLWSHSLWPVNRHKVLWNCGTDLTVRRIYADKWSMQLGVKCNRPSYSGAIWISRLLERQYR